MTLVSCSASGEVTPPDNIIYIVCSVTGAQWPYLCHIRGFARSAVSGTNLSDGGFSMPLYWNVPLREREREC